MGTAAELSGRQGAGKVEVVVAGAPKLAPLLEQELGVECSSCEPTPDDVVSALDGLTPRDAVVVVFRNAGSIIAALAGEGWQVLCVGDGTEPVAGASFVPISCPPATLFTMIETMIDEIATLPPEPEPEDEPEHDDTPSTRSVQTDQPSDKDTSRGSVHKGGDVVAVVSPKGGTGKSTLSLLMSLGIAEAYGDTRRVCIVDANVGQADSRKYLSLDNATTITALAARAEYEQGDPDVVGAVMTEVPKTSLRALLGPRFSEYDPAVVTPALYRRAVGALRQIYDVVVIDTPAAGEAIGIIEDFVLEEADRIVVVVDPNDITLSNVVEWLLDITTPVAGGGLGADPSSICVVLNQAEDKAGVGEQDISVLLGQWEFIGSIPRLVELKRGMNAAEEPADLLKILHGQMGDALRSVIAKVVGDESLAPTAAKASRGLLRRMGAALSL